jgi:hypothetical protein
MTPSLCTTVACVLLLTITHPTHAQIRLPHQPPLAVSQAPALYGLSVSSDTKAPYVTRSPSLLLPAYNLLTPRSLRSPSPALQAPGCSLYALYGCAEQETILSPAPSESLHHKAITDAYRLWL